MTHLTIEEFIKELAECEVVISAVPQAPQRKAFIDAIVERNRSHGDLPELLAHALFRLETIRKAAGDVLEQMPACGRGCGVGGSKINRLSQQTDPVTHHRLISRFNKAMAKNLDFNVPKDPILFMAKALNAKGLDEIEGAKTGRFTDTLNQSNSPKSKRLDSVLAVTRPRMPEYSDSVTQSLGFANSDEMVAMVAKVDLSDSGKLRAFETWKRVDGTRDGLAKLPTITE